MSKPKSITQQIEELQSENLRLKELEVLLDKAIRITFANDTKSLKKIIDFDSRICSYFGLKNASDKEAFLRIMCTESSLNFFKNRLANESTSEQG